MKHHPKNSQLDYHRNASNSSLLSSLVYTFLASGEIILILGMVIF